MLLREAVNTWSSEMLRERKSRSGPPGLAIVGKRRAGEAKPFEKASPKENGAARAGCFRPWRAFRRPCWFPAS